MLMAGLLAVFLRCPLTAASPDELLRESLKNYQRDYREGVLHFTYVERDIDNSKTSVDQEMLVNGLPYEMAVSRNDRPLTPAEEAKEREKLEKRRNESPDERAKRVRERESSLAFLNEVPEAFTFRLLGEEPVKGRPAYILECKPKPGYHPRDSRSAMFTHIEAKIWIDKEDIQWAKAEAKVLDTISIGWILARFGPGATMLLEQTRLSDKYWLPSQIDVNGDAKILLVKNRPVRERMIYSDFKPIDPANLQAQK
jgi:hypothetical protein